MIKLILADPDEQQFLSNEELEHNFNCLLVLISKKLVLNYTKETFWRKINWLLFVNQWCWNIIPTIISHYIGISINFKSTPQNSRLCVYVFPFFIFFFHISAIIQSADISKLLILLKFYWLKYLNPNCV